MKSFFGCKGRRLIQAAVIGVVTGVIAVSSFGFFVHSMVFFHYLLAPAIWLAMVFDLWLAPIFWVILAVSQVLYYLMLLLLVDLFRSNQKCRNG